MKTYVYFYHIRFEKWCDGNRNIGSYSGTYITDTKIIDYDSYIIFVEYIWKYLSVQIPPMFCKNDMQIRTLNFLHEAEEQTCETCDHFCWEKGKSKPLDIETGKMLGFSEAEIKTITLDYSTICHCLLTQKVWSCPSNVPIQKPKDINCFWKKREEKKLPI